MGRHCCCGQDQKPPLYCDPLNCPLCSCVGTEENPVAEEIRYKDFLTAKYKLDGFKDISYAHNFSGNGGTVDYINQDFKNNPTYSTYLNIPLKGILNQYYQLTVSGFEVLNGEEFIFDLANDQSVGCIYKPRIECLIPYGEVSLEEYFSYDLNATAHAYMNRVFMIRADVNCCSKYDFEHRGCWYEAPVQWGGIIGYKATYQLYIKLNSHRAISSIYQETKTPECSENPNSQDPPPCDNFPNCDNCIDHPIYRSINGAIEIYLVLQSCTPILGGMEETTGKYVRYYKGDGEMPSYIDFEYINNCGLRQNPTCGNVVGCVLVRGTECESISKYKYAQCNQPFNHGYAYGWNSLLDHTNNQYIYLNAGRTGLSDTIWRYFHQEINGVNEYLLGIYYENWQNFSFLKQLPFIPPVNFSGSVKYINSFCCPTFLDVLTEKCKTSVLKIPISICPTEHVCYKYDAASEELKDTYRAYSVIDSFERNKMPAEKDCEDNTFVESYWRQILRCSDFPDTDPECVTEGTGRFAGFNLFYSNDLLPYLFRNDRHLYIGNGQYTCPDNENYFTSDKVYCFKPYIYQEKPFKNLIRHAIFGLDNNYYYWSNYAQRFFYENDCLDNQSEDCRYGIELIKKYYPCRACICFNTGPVNPFNPQNFQAPDGDNENKNLNPNNPEPPPPDPPHNPDPPNIPDPNDPNPPSPDPPSGPFPPPPPPLPPPTSPIPNPNPNPPTPSPPGSLPDCVCNALDTDIPPTIYQFEADWEVMDQVSSVYTYIESTKCIVEKAFILPAPWDLKMEVTYK